MEPVTRKDQILRSESLLLSPFEQLLFFKYPISVAKMCFSDLLEQRGPPRGGGARVRGGRRGFLHRGASLGGIWDRGALVGGSGAVGA